MIIRRMHQACFSGASLVLYFTVFTLVCSVKITYHLVVNYIPSIYFILQYKVSKV